VGTPGRGGCLNRSGRPSGERARGGARHGRRVGDEPELDPGSDGWLEVGDDRRGPPVRHRGGGARALGRKPAGPWQAEGGEVAGRGRLGSTAGLQQIGLEIKMGQKWGGGRRAKGEGFPF
jgi:hypothetical protein